MIGLVISMMLIVTGLVASTRVPTLAGFEISPNPMQNHTNIHLEFSGQCYVTVYIEEEGGAIIKHLYNGIVSKNVVLGWNRISDSGIYVPAGAYSVVVNYQGRYTSTKKTLILK